MAYNELGIDEAGRGPVLGPMVMAAVMVPSSAFEMLRDWGITDSKSFGSGSKGREKREKLACLIKERFPWKTVVINPSEIDRFVADQQLNVLERSTARKLIDCFKPDTVVLDGHRLFASLCTDTIQAINKADMHYPSVGAASILAKVERDRLFSDLCLPFQEQYGEIKGGGYANKSTLAFVKWHRHTFGDLPPFYRRSYRWKALRTV